MDETKCLTCKINHDEKTYKGVHHFSLRGSFLSNLRTVKFEIEPENCGIGDAPEALALRGFTTQPTKP